MPTPGKRCPPTIEDVVRNYQCTSCGICAAICTAHAISLSIGPTGAYWPVIDHARCTECGLCYKVCPGHEFPAELYFQLLYGGLPIHAALGPYKVCYVGYSLDPEVLTIAQSGGFVSSMLLFGISRGIFDGAVVTRWSRTDPLRPSTYIATDRTSVLASVGSKYNPVPACAVVSEILARTGRFAFVGTSCQIQAMRKAELIIPRLKSKIAAYIGLHCLGVFTYHFLDYILHRLGLRPVQVEKFRHRDKAWRGWPCDMRVVAKDGRVFDLTAEESRLWPRPFFTNWRCRLCFDKGNEFSDISCGDCRIPEAIETLKASGYDTTRGISEIVVRTDRGADLMESFLADGSFRVIEVSPDAVASSIGVVGKKLGASVFARAAKLLGYSPPHYGVSYQLPQRRRTWKNWMCDQLNCAVAVLYFAIYWLQRFAGFRRLMRMVPQRVFSYIGRVTEGAMIWRREARKSQLIVIPEKESDDSSHKP